jgi:hypothetical protein
MLADHSFVFDCVKARCGELERHEGYARESSAVSGDA